MKFTKGISGNTKERPRIKNMELRELINVDAVRAYKLLWKSIQENQLCALDLFLKAKGYHIKLLKIH